MPTIIQLENFPQYADQAAGKFPVYADHMRDLYTRRLDTLRSAFEAGVPVYAGTDAGGVLGHGLVAQEIQALTTIGMTGEQALAAGSWSAREWLGANPAPSPPAPRPTSSSTTKTPAPPPPSSPTPATSSSAAASTT